MFWISLALFAQLTFSISNFIDRYLVEKRVRDPFFLTVLGGFIGAIFGIIILIFKNFPTLPIEQTLILLASGIMLSLGLVPWYKAVSLDDPSRIIPIFRLIPIIVMIASYFLIGERLTILQIAGSIVIIIGSLLLSIEKFSGEVFKPIKSLKYIALAIPLFALPSVLFKFVSIENDFWTTIAYQFLGSGIGALILFFLTNSVLKKSTSGFNLSTWGIIAFNELIYILGDLALFYAVALGSVSLISVVSGVQPVFAFLIGLLLTIWFPRIVKEDISKRTIILKLLAIGIIFIGGFLIIK